MKSAIVTGCTSFIGLSLIKNLAEKGVTVYAISRPGSSRLKKIPLGNNIYLVECELADVHNAKLPATQVDAIFHIGWSSDFSTPRFNKQGQLLNVEYAKNAMYLAEKYNCKSFLGIGSQAECGLVNGCISVNTPANPITEYAKAKVATFQELKKISEKNGVNLFWPRLLSAYGPNDRNHTLIMSCINAALENKTIELTAGEQIWDYIYVDDVAEAIYRIVEFGKPATHYPIGSGVGRSLRSYIEELAGIVGNDSILQGIGAKEYSNNQVMNLLADMSDVKKDTGFTCQVDFRSGIKKTISYILNN